MAWDDTTNNFVFVPAVRISDSIRYTSADYHGVTLRGSYGIGNENPERQPSSPSKTSGGALSYRHDKLSIDLYY